MRIFQLTSIAFKGYIEFRFNENTLLESYENHADLTEKQQVFLLKNIPREIPELEKLRSANVTIVELKEDITFEMFWNRYDDKLNSSKKRAEQKWNKMTLLIKRKLITIFSATLQIFPWKSAKSTLRPI